MTCQDAAGYKLLEPQSESEIQVFLQKSKKMLIQLAYSSEYANWIHGQVGSRYYQYLMEWDS